MVDLIEISQISAGSIESMVAGGAGLSVEEPTSDTALVNSLVAQGVLRVSDKCTTRVQQSAVFPSVKQPDVAVRQTTCVLPSTSQAPAHTSSLPSSMTNHSDNPPCGGQTAEAEAAATCSENIAVDSDCGLGSARCQNTDVGQTAAFSAAEVETTATCSENIAVDNDSGLGSARCQSTDVGQTAAFPCSGECDYSGLPDSVGILSPQLEESSASEVPVEHSIPPSNTHSMSKKIDILFLTTIMCRAETKVRINEEYYLVAVERYHIFIIGH
ncbi:hypothetical protein V6N12_047568 [Hibiscus sabdariffa]|uniref:Uncharacterized protein n=1 Tax=Hibiscus sabdariffa TaxID=183260 RepID=A0ABR2DB81_9ROSI